MLFSKKIKLLIVTIIVITIISIPSIYASDFENLTAEHDQVTSTSNLTLEKNAVGTFDELKNDISNLSPGDIYNMDKDYIFDQEYDINGAPSILPKPGIKINIDNVTINGNNHVIDGNNKTAIFTVNGNNVKFFNITFINSKDMSSVYTLRSEYNKLYNIKDIIVNYTFNTSPIYWSGDNGLISNCEFFNNAAIIGGAITWKGNNGTIFNSKFINNTARGAGGAIYILGQNITILNSTFNNSKSLITKEAIYLDNWCESYNISSRFFDCKPLVNSAKIDINIYYLCYTYSTYFSDKFINLIDVLYSSIVNNCTHYCKDNIIYYSARNGTEFLLNLARSFDDVGIIYGKTYHFSNIHSYTDIFTSLLNDNYKTELTFIKKMMVYNINDYEKAIRTDDSVFNVDSFEKIMENDVKNLITKSYSEFSELIITFGGSYHFESRLMWEPSNRFNMIIINGNGSTISGSSSRSDEYDWAQLKDTSCIFCVNDLTVDGFNMGIENIGGTCILNNVKFNNNQMDWLIYQDYGAGICNTGTCICNNCVFTNNYCKHGGAIFSQGYLEVNNCTFKNNQAYGEGDDICNTEKGTIKMDGVKLTGDRNHVTFVESITKKERTIIAVVAPIVATIIGVFVGALCFCPQLGLVFGAIAGTGVGVIAAKYVCSHTYDLTFNRVGFCIVLIAQCALAGAIGGAIGGSLTAPQEAPMELIDMESNGYQVSEGSSGLFSESSSQIGDGLSELSKGDLKYVEYLVDDIIK